MGNNRYLLSMDENSLRIITTALTIINLTTQIPGMTGERISKMLETLANLKAVDKNVVDELASGPDLTEFSKLYLHFHKIFEPLDDEIKKSGELSDEEDYNTWSGVSNWLNGAREALEAVGYEWNMGKNGFEKVAGDSLYGKNP